MRFNEQQNVPAGVGGTWGFPGCSATQLGVARSTTAALGAGVKLLDESAEARIGLPSILRVGGVHKLVAVVIHFHSAARTNHLDGNFSHGSYPHVF